MEDLIGLDKKYIKFVNYKTLHIACISTVTVLYIIHNRIYV